MPGFWRAVKCSGLGLDGGELLATGVLQAADIRPGMLPPGPRAAVHVKGVVVMYKLLNYPGYIVVGGACLTSRLVQFGEEPLGGESQLRFDLDALDLTGGRPGGGAEGQTPGTGGKGVEMARGWKRRRV